MVSITEILNEWANMGVFSYVFPFLLVFAIVFGLLQNLKIFGADQNKTKGINAVIAISLGFLALLNDYVSTFFATIFPRFGIALAIFLVLMILLGFFYRPGNDGSPNSALKWIGWVLTLGVVFWAWNNWSSSFGLTEIFPNFSISDNMGAILILGGVIALIFFVLKGSSSSGGWHEPTGGHSH